MSNNPLLLPKTGFNLGNVAIGFGRLFASAWGPLLLQAALVAIALVAIRTLFADAMLTGIEIDPDTLTLEQALEAAEASGDPIEQQGQILAATMSAFLTVLLPFLGVLLLAVLLESAMFRYLTHRTLGEPVTFVTALSEALSVRTLRLIGFYALTIGMAVAAVLVIAIVSGLFGSLAFFLIMLGAAALILVWLAAVTVVPPFIVVEDDPLREAVSHGWAIARGKWSRIILYVAIFWLGILLISTLISAIPQSEAAPQGVVETATPIEDQTNEQGESIGPPSEAAMMISKREIVLAFYDGMDFSVILVSLFAGILARMLMPPLFFSVYLGFRGHMDPPPPTTHEMDEDIDED